MSSDRRIILPLDGLTGVAPLVEATFVPQRYEPNYAYPLLVLLHARAGDEQQMVRSMPALSWRNYVGLSLRGPEPFLRRGQQDGYGWGPAFVRPSRWAQQVRSEESPSEAFQRRIRGGSPDLVEV